MPRGADLHVHTTHSDGVCSPCEVVNAAANLGLAAVAITDHDTVSAVSVALPEAQRRGIELVPGIELTAEFAGREVHVLGHFLQVDHPALLATLASMRELRLQRFEAMAGRLEPLGLNVNVDAIRAAFPRAALGRRHLADWLTRTRQVGSLREAFVRYLGDAAPGHVAKPRLPFGDAIALVTTAGGVAGLAHPPYDLRESALAELVDAGLGAIEVAGPGINPRLGKRWLAWSEQFDLVPIAGSDFHAGDRPGRWIGSTTTAHPELHRLRTRSHTQHPTGDRPPSTNSPPA